MAVFSCLSFESSGHSFSVMKNGGNTGSFEIESDKSIIHYHN